MKSTLQWTVLICYFAYLEAVTFRCDYKYTALGWFKYHRIPAVWQDAQLQCKYEGGILASPLTLEMRSAMLDSYNERDIFTGLHATYSNGLNYHSIDGIPLDQIPYEWNDHEPDNKNNSEHCLTMNRDGKLSDVQCNEPYPYICYRKKTYEDATVCGTPDREYYYYYQTNKCYKFHTTPRTFAPANLVCSAEGGHLVIINSESEANVISDLYSKYPDSRMFGKFWKGVALIGFTMGGVNSEPTTIHGQSLKEAGYDKFGKDQPDTFTSDYQYCGTVFRDGTLNDAACNEHYAFICEKSTTYPAVCESDNVKLN